MNLSVESSRLKFRFEDSKQKLGVSVWGDRRFFYELHELLDECWNCENIDMSPAEACSYIGVISYFGYEVRHAFMGHRLVLMDGKPVKVWSDELFHLFEKEQERFEVGVDFSWPHMLFIMSAWWECLRHHDCPMRVLAIMREFTDNMEMLLQKRSKVQYPLIEPYIHGAIYAANPYLMHFMEYVNEDFLQWSRYGRVSLSRFADMMSCSSFGTFRYIGYMDRLRRKARKLGCSIEEMRVQG